MKKLILILSLSLAWCFPAHATDATDFKGCIKDGDHYKCSYVNPYQKNSALIGCANNPNMPPEEKLKPRFHKYCDPNYTFSVDANSQAEAEQKAKDYLSKNP